ncbi:MAG: hypothetical protein J6040_04815 [Clostridiales bacterium]|nr:hypothetical protein [Clostridiales bacterium]
MRKTIAVLLLICMLTALAACTKKKTDNSSEEKAKMEELFQKNCSADEALKLAKESDVVVMEDLVCISGKNVWDDFYKAVSGGNPASVLCATYYTIDKNHMSPELYEQEKDKYPCLYFTLVEYDGNVFKTKVRDSKSDTIEGEESYKYIQHFTGNPPPTALYSTYDYYVLLDEKAENWEEIEAGLFSSQYGAYRKHKIIYSDCR